MAPSGAVFSNNPEKRLGYATVSADIADAVTDSVVKQLTLVILYSKDAGKILLAMKKRGFGAGKYNGFGGKVEPNESVLAGAMREFEEESGASVDADQLRARGILTFVFRGNPKVMQVHLFTGELSALRGETRETEEMRPQYFSIDEIPFETMWPDDKFWFPWMLDGRDFEASFLFAEDESTVLQHEIVPPRGPLESVRRLAPADVFGLPDLSAFVGSDLVHWRTAAMKEDADVAVRGPRVLLVPYSPEHVEPYHAWMQDAELRRLTGSEPLSLEEEVEMQQKWAAEYDKATFIVMHRETGTMVGDVNLFFYEDEQYHAEINVMIADAGFRRQGLAQEALRLMLHYAYRRLGAREFAAKIDEDNAPSIALFEKLGFERESYSSAFKQVCLMWRPSQEQACTVLLDSTDTYHYVPRSELPAEEGGD